MRATRINHVSIVADDLDESARFYEELFGMERVPTAKFPEPVLWLRIGEQQLHLFKSDADARRRASTCRSRSPTSTPSTRRQRGSGSSTRGLSERR